MAVVSSYGELQGITPPTWSYGENGGNGPISLFASSPQAYDAIYRTQPNVRTCIDFLARNIAHLGIHFFRAISETDRERLRDYPAADWLEHPNPSTTRYMQVFQTVVDLMCHGFAIWIKVRRPDRIGFVRIPPTQIQIVRGLLVTGFIWTRLNGSVEPLDPGEVVFFGGGPSPLEALRQILAESKAASDHRAYFWQNAARIDGVIQVAADGPNYTPDQMLKYRENWQTTHAAQENAGKTAMLPRGMTFNPTAWSMKDSEYSTARKLNREEVAAAFHIPLPMVGILEHATFSNIVEQHKNLYTDCLGPTIEMLQEELERQVLIEVSDAVGVYIEFNFAEKLKGSFEEQAAALLLLVGRPIMTGNEGRARLNLPAITDDPSADELAGQQGGTAPGSPAAVPAAIGRKRTPPAAEALIDVHRDRHLAKLDAVQSDERIATYDRLARRWAHELEVDLRSVVSDADARRLAHHAITETRPRVEEEALV